MSGIVPAAGRGKTNPEILALADERSGADLAAERERIRTTPVGYSGQTIASHAAAKDTDGTDRWTRGYRSAMRDVAALLATEPPDVTGLRLDRGYWRSECHRDLMAAINDAVETAYRAGVQHGRRSDGTAP